MEDNDADGGGGLEEGIGKVRKNQDSNWYIKDM